jgi:hypothetical protein
VFTVSIDEFDDPLVFVAKSTSATRGFGVGVVCACLSHVQPQPLILD